MSFSNRFLNSYIHTFRWQQFNSCSQYKLLLAFKQKKALFLVYIPTGRKQRSGRSSVNFPNNTVHISSRRNQYSRHEHTSLLQQQHLPTDRAAHVLQHHQVARHCSTGPAKERKSDLHCGHRREQKRRAANCRIKLRSLPRQAPASRPAPCRSAPRSAVCANTVPCARAQRPALP